MFDDWAWKSYNKVIKEVKEPTPFKSAAQKRYKRQRRKNDIYTTKGGLKNLKSGAPFNNKVKRFGTDRLRFENLKEIVDDGVDFSTLEPKDNLSASIWESGQIKDEVKDHLIQVSHDFMDFMDLDVNIQDLLLVGSMAGYNYSKHSDIDLHIVLDFKDISEDKELLERYFSLAKSKWNRSRGTVLFGHDVEVYVEDIGDDRIPSATYSLTANKWLNEPSRDNMVIDYEGVSKKVQEKLGEIDELESLHGAGEYEEAFNLAKSLRSKIRNFRQSGLDREGEYSNENLAFKVLRRSGALERLNSLAKNSYRKMRSTA
jgi:hypothetical protein